VAKGKGIEAKRMGTACLCFYLCPTLSRIARDQRAAPPHMPAVPRTPSSLLVGPAHEHTSTPVHTQAAAHAHLHGRRQQQGQALVGEDTARPKGNHLVFISCHCFS
jgi:hypothetical protein